MGLVKSKEAELQVAFKAIYLHTLRDITKCVIKTWWSVYISDWLIAAYKLVKEECIWR